MNLKKSALSLVAVATISLSMFAPAFAQDSSRELTSSVDEGGEFTYSFNGNPISFSGSVDTYEGVVAGPQYRGFNYHDSQAYSDGFNLQIAADDFTTTTTDGTFKITKDNLRVAKRADNDTCPNALNPSLGEEGGNKYQTLSILGTHTPNFVTFEGPLNIVTGTDGRGCGAKTLSVTYWLNIPAGTYTDNGTAVYTTDLTLTNTFAPATGDEPTGD